MATAVEPGYQPRTPTPPLSLSIASLLGAAYIIATIAVVLYGIPLLWTKILGEQLAGNSFSDWALRQGLRLAAALGLLFVGRKLLGEAPPKGVRGGIFLILTSAIVIFFIWRIIALNINGMSGMVFSSVIGIALVIFAVRFFAGKMGEGWMVGLEEQGWFHTSSYKRSLGQKVRRLTILGVLLIGGSGIYSLSLQGVLPENWVVSMPFDFEPVLVLPDARFTIPVILAVLTLWLAYRVANVPAFAEFLIATEAEMNKVSWTPKKRLAQDTIVVLTTTLLMSLFLLVVDIFWGWLLSLPQVGVLPVKSTAADKAGKAQQAAKW
jgi:preprotein translocase SecE subunit